MGAVCVPSQVIALTIVRLVSEASDDILKAIAADYEYWGDSLQFLKLLPEFNRMQECGNNFHVALIIHKLM